MIGMKIENGVVANCAVFEELPEGWVAQPNGVGMGWSDNGDGTFSPPVRSTPEVTVATQIAELETAVRDRAGTADPLGFVADLEAQIEVLRS